METILTSVMMGLMLMLALRWVLAIGFRPFSRQLVRQLFLQQIRAKMPQAEITADTEERVLVHLDGHEGTISLVQLFRRCEETPAGTGYFVQQAVNTIRQVLTDQYALPKDWQQRVIPLFLVKPPGDAATLVARSLPGGFQLGYALPGKAWLRWITLTDIAQCDLCLEELHAVALRNLERSYSILCIETPAETDEGHESVFRFRTGDGLDAARVLIPSFFTRFSPRFADADLIVAVPTRDTLVAVSAHDRRTIQWLAGYAREEHRRAAYPLYRTLLRVSAQGLKRYQPQQQAATTAYMPD